MENSKYTIADFCNGVRIYLQKYNIENRPNSRFIYRRGKNTRISMIRSENNQAGKIFNSTLYQTIEVFPMTPVDSANAGCKVFAGDVVSKSKFTLPKPIDTDSGRPALRIFNINYTSQADFLAPEEILGNGTKKYKYPGLQAWFSNNHLFIDKIVQGVKITGLFENPEDIDFYNTCFTYDDCGEVVQEEKCSTPMMQREFPLGYLKEAIELKTAQNIAQFYGFSIQDTRNNAKDESELQGKTR